MVQATPTRSSARSQLGLTFAGDDGPLVAVVGLCGGAGASTIAHLLAGAAARESTAPVLLAETGSVTGALAAYANARSRRSLLGLAREVEQGAVAGGAPFAIGADGLRVIASGPCVVDDLAAESAVEEVLRHARAAHGLTVVDCADPSRAIDGAVLAAATHVLWVVPATLGPLRRARAILDALDPCVDAREILVARHDASARPAPLAELADLAARQRAPVVLVPHIADVEEVSFDARVEQAGIALHDLAGVLRR